MIKMFMCPSSGHLALDPTDKEGAEALDRLVDFLETLEIVEVGWDKAEAAESGGFSAEFNKGADE